MRCCIFNSLIIMGLSKNRGGVDENYTIESYLGLFLRLQKEERKDFGIINPLKFGITAENQWVFCSVINLEKMVSLWIT